MALSRKKFIHANVEDSSEKKVYLVKLAVNTFKTGKGLENEDIMMRVRLGLEMIEKNAASKEILKTMGDFDKTPGDITLT